MTTRNFNALFEPSAIALIGASNRPGSVGEVLARNLLESGFSGAVLPVNPHERAVRSALAYPSVADLPVTPDLAVIATPAVIRKKRKHELKSKRGLSSWRRTSRVTTYSAMLPRLLTFISL